MKRIIFVFLPLLFVSFNVFGFTKKDAEEKIRNYISDIKYVSKINICENDKYYIGEVYLEEYEGLSQVRKVYVSKKDGEILPTMAENFDYCYMLEGK
ncbi:hypothetical protein [Persephonella sp.]